MVSNGSFGLVDTGKKKLLVTCNHVLEGYDRELEKFPDLRLRIAFDSGPPFELSRDRFMGDKRLDIATFDMDEFENNYADKKFFPLQECPELSTGDPIIIMGFPGHTRHSIGEYAVFGPHAYALGVSSIDGFKFHADTSRIESKGDEFRGISGGPCFVFREGSQVQLAGFTGELQFDYLAFTSSRCINADGTLRNTHP